MTRKQFLIDFDGTCVHNIYPYVGGDIPYAVDVLRKLVAAGHELILFTMRHDELLRDAEAWFRMKEIPLFAKNCNPSFETGSRKIYGHVVIDDHNIGIPLYREMGMKPYVNWYEVEKLLIEQGYINHASHK